MKVAILSIIVLAAMTLSASAQQCIWQHCGYSLRLHCDPRCCDLNPYTCMRSGPIHPVPRRVWPYPRWQPAPGPHGAGPGFK